MTLELSIVLIVLAPTYTLKYISWSDIHNLKSALSPLHIEANVNTICSLCQANQRCSEREWDDVEEPRAFLSGEVPRSEVQHWDCSPQQLWVSGCDRSAAGQVEYILCNACVSYDLEGSRTHFQCFYTPKDTHLFTKPATDINVFLFIYELSQIYQKVDSHSLI